MRTPSFFIQDRAQAQKPFGIKQALARLLRASHSLPLK